MKTLEFKLYLTRSQQQTLDDWLAALKYPWNKGVEIIKRFNEFNHYDKRFKQSHPCCPIVSYNHQFRAAYPSSPVLWELEDFKEGDAITNKAPCGVYPVRSHNGGKRVSDLSFFSIQGCFTHKENLDKPWLTAVPSKFIDGIVLLVASSWQAFLKGDRKPPKFKGKNKSVDTLINNNSKEIRVRGDRVNIPKLGWVKAKGLSRRWPVGVPFCPLKICRKASGYYLQLTGDIDGGATPKRKPKPPRIPAVGLDPGIEHVYVDDRDRRVKPPEYLERGLKRLKNLQRKAQRQWDANTGNKEWQRKNWRKTQKKIARLHEKIARRGRAFNHFESTKLVRQFQTLYLEDYKPSEVIKKVAPVDSGKLVVNTDSELTRIYDKNGRFLNRAANRSAQRNRVGQLWEMIKSKGGDRVVLIARSGTSCECPKCGDIQEKQLRQRIHRCQVCGYKTHRDTAAAQVIKKRGVENAQTPSCTNAKPKKKRQNRFQKKDSSAEAS